MKISFVWYSNNLNFKSLKYNSIRTLTLLSFVIVFWGGIALGTKPGQNNLKCSPVLKAVYAWDTHTVGNYYSSAPADFLDKMAAEKGLSNCKDMKTIVHELRAINLNSAKAQIIEVGSGNGRVVDWARKNLPEANLIGYEVAKASAGKLSEKFGKDPKVKVIADSFLNANENHKVDVVLWPWSGFLELNPSEKSAALHKASNVLKNEGALVLDLPLEIGSDQAKAESEADFLKIDDGFGVFHAHLMNSKTIEQEALKAGLKLSKRVQYITDPYTDANEPKNNHQGLKREILIFKKNE